MAIFKLGKQLPLTDPGNVLFSLTDTFVGQCALSLSLSLSLSSQKKKPKWTLGLTAHKGHSVAVRVLLGEVQCRVCRHCLDFTAPPPSLSTLREYSQKDSGWAREGCGYRDEGELP